MEHYLKISENRKAPFIQYFHGNDLRGNRIFGSPKLAFFFLLVKSNLVNSNLSF